MPRKNPTETTVELELNGETFTLFFDFEAVANAEEVTGLPLILGLTERTIAQPRVSIVRAMFWACLRPKHPKITREEAAKMVTQHTVQSIWVAVLEAWTAAMIEQEETAGDPLKGQS